MSQPDLATCRERIDAIDEQLVELLNQRAAIARDVGRAKATDGGAIFVPHREQEVLARITALNAGPLPDSCLQAIWREIMSGSLALERPLRICHFAEPGSFTHFAARRKFGHGVSYQGAATIAEVFAEVERGNADYGVVPIENSTDGGISDTSDRLLNTPLQIVSEMTLRIRHHLMAANPDDTICRIYSKHTVFGQCQRWLAGHMPGVELIEVGSTTKAAQRVATEPGGAAIGNREAAEEFGLQVIAEDIEDNPTNITRFVVLADRAKAAEPTGHDKTSLMFAIQDRPGALYQALVPFHEAGISLTRIESRPSRRQPWEYLFFIDILAHHRQAEVAAALERLAALSSVLQVLGSYPQATAPLND